MNLAKVIGNLWATQKVPELEGLKLMIIQPLTSDFKNIGSPLVSVDHVGIGIGEIVYYVTSKEAILPLKNQLTPVDAGIVGIVDRIDK
ncbi:EutN/CcmL family microcompartment protein [bacterium]|nr:EutN/CcmL family microcompartment protein [bacterium]